MAVVLRMVLAVVVIVFSLLLRLLLLVAAVSMLLLCLDAVHVYGKTIVLPWLGQPLKESYMNLSKLPKMPTMLLYMYPFASLFLNLSNLAFCLNLILMFQAFLILQLNALHCCRYSLLWLIKFSNF